MSSLIVTLPASPASDATEFDYVLSHDGQTVARHTRARADLLPTPQEARDGITAVVPAQALAWHPVRLPAGLRARDRQGPRLRAVLVGLLEDQLLDEPERLHITYFPPGAGTAPDTPGWAAVCRRDALQQALATLAAAGRPVSRVVPECAPTLLASEPARLCVATGLMPAALLLSHAHGASALPLTPASAALALDRSQWPTDAPVTAEPAVAALAEHLLQRPVQLQTAAERALHAARHDAPWNLAQGEFAQHGRARLLQATVRLRQQIGQSPAWRAARWSALALVLVQLIGLNAWAWQQRKVLAAQQLAQADLLRQTFPDTSLVIDAPAQMARAVAELRRSRGQTDAPGLDQLLHSLGQALPAGLVPTALTLDAQGAVLGGLPALAPDAWQTLSAQLRAQGWAAAQDQGQIRLTRLTQLTQPPPQPALAPRNVTATAP